MFCTDGYISVMSNDFTDQHGPKPPLPGEVARRSQDGEVAANLIQPLSQPPADSSPGRGSLWGAFCRGGALLRPCFRQNQHPRAEQSPAPTGCEANNEIQCKKVQTGKSGLHLLFLANILRQLAANLESPYQAARSRSPVRWLSSGTTLETLGVA